MKYLVIMPTYNEANNILVQLEKIKEVRAKGKYNLEVLVVDDSSPDGTSDIVLNYAKDNTFVHLLKRTAKNGLKEAYFDSFDYAEKFSPDKIIMMDADGSHDPMFLHDLIRLSNDYHLVIGSRYTKNGKIKNWKFHRRFVSQFGNIYSKLLLGIGISDLTTGFQLIDYKILRQVNYRTIKSKGYVFQIELKYLIYKATKSIIETPISFVDREEGESKFNVLILIEAFLKIPLVRFRN